MKRSLLLLAFLFATTTLSAQTSIARIMNDTDQVDYVWAKGYGETIEQADKDAMNQLLRNGSLVFVSSNSTITQDSENYKHELTSLSNVYLENVGREVLPDERGAKCVLRYMTREAWESHDKMLKSKIEDYISSGKYTSAIDDKLRYFTWAYILVQSYLNDKEPIEIGDVPAKSYLYEAIGEVLDNIEISVIGVEHNKEDRNYPYKVYLDFLYNQEPIGYMQYAYFDGNSYVYDESIKDGRGVILMKSNPSEVIINIDYIFEDLARSHDTTVSVLMNNPQFVPTFAEAQKRISVGVKPQKSIDTTSPKVESMVNNHMESIEENYVEVKDKVSNTKSFETIMVDIVGAIQNATSADIQHHFTDTAWKHYKRIVAEGSPKLARTPEYKYIKHDTITICHSLPLKLRFSGNKSFVEDVVFRVNNRTMKVESVAYKLSKKTEEKIMAMSWDDSARLTLLTFLEDYRTAYCLRDIEYIDKVFSDDAYIITGRVLKRSNKKFGDTPYHADLNNENEVIYTRKTKEQYLYDLNKSFISKEFVNIRFEECNAAKGYSGKEGIYAVQVRQLYYSNNYSDEGILTLAIDMRESTNPLVRVRVWQDERDVTYDAEKMIEITVAVSNSLN